MGRVDPVGDQGACLVRARPLGAVRACQRMARRQRAAYFDASPEYPSTMPLLQVWNCICLGRWDDTLMNWPWWQIGTALTFAVYGGLRSQAVSALPALVGAFLVASLPLANVHVALAGYADLPLAAFYTAAALALLRWTGSRDLRDAALTLLFALACTQIKNPGWFWAFTLVPGVMVALFAALRCARGGDRLRRRRRCAGRIGAHEVHIVQLPGQSQFRPGVGRPGRQLLPARQLASPLVRRDRRRAARRPAVARAHAGAADDGRDRRLAVPVLRVRFHTNASQYIRDQTTVNRATLHMAPLIVVFMVLAWQAFAQRWVAAHPEPAMTAELPAS